MLSGTVSYLMKSDTLVKLLMKTFSRRTVGRMECGIVTIGTPSATDCAIPVRTGKTRIQNYLLEALTISALEIADKGIISFPAGKNPFIKLN